MQLSGSQSIRLEQAFVNKTIWNPLSICPTGNRSAVCVSQQTHIENSRSLVPSVWPTTGSRGVAYGVAVGLPFGRLLVQYTSWACIQPVSGNCVVANRLVTGRCWAPARPVTGICVVAVRPLAGSRRAAVTPVTGNRLPACWYLCGSYLSACWYLSDSCSCAYGTVGHPFGRSLALVTQLILTL